MNPLVSVVVPINNTEKYLIKCVNSIIAQSYKNIEIILVDDGSTDSSPALCEELKKTDERLSVIHKENGGLSSARNEGINRASGDYIMFIDSDDELAESSIEDMVEIAIAKKSDAVIPITYYKVYEYSGKTEQVFHFDEDMFSENPKKFALDVLIGKCRASRSTAVLYSLSIIKDNNICYPLGIVSEDFFFNIGFFSFSQKISLYKKPSLYNLKRVGSLSNSYHEDFFDTVLYMDDETEKFLKKLDGEKNNYNIFGKRETLLFKNVLFYSISVMSNTAEPYRSRVKKCKQMFRNERVRNAVSNGAGIPYFASRIKQNFVKVSLLLVKLKLYDLACLLAYFASEIKAEDKR